MGTCIAYVRIALPLLLGIRSEIEASVFVGANTTAFSTQNPILDTGPLSDANTTPRGGDESEAWKAISGPGSKHSSLSSHETSLVQQSLGSSFNKTVCPLSVLSCTYFCPIQAAISG